MFLATLALLATTANAGLRPPQVPVSGTELQAFFTLHTQAIHAVGDQIDGQRFALTGNGNSGPTLQPTFFGTPGDANDFGLYNAGLASPSLYLVFPGAASVGWSAVASFRTARRA